MNHRNFSNNLLKNVCLFYFWEPFHLSAKEKKEESFKGILKLIYQNYIGYFKGRKEALAFTKVAIDTTLLVNPTSFSKKTVLADIISQFSSVSYIPKTKIIEDSELRHIVTGHLALKYTLQFLWWYFTLRGYEKIAYRKNFWHIYYDIGMYRLVFLQLRNSKVGAFLGENDHRGINQITYTACRRLGIKTIYVQHAVVNSKFPPLQADLSLLQGETAIDNYVKITKPKSKIVLVGSPKYDKALQSLNSSRKGKYVGFCVNMISVEEFELLLTTIAELNQNFKVCIRFHPHLPQKSRELFENMDVEYSYPEDEKEIDFIINCFAVISGDSSILLDSVVLKRWPIYFTQSSRFNDYYGFLKNGVVKKRTTTIKEILNELEFTKEDLAIARQNAKKYISTLNTQNEGFSTQLVVDEISKLLEY